MWMLLKMLVSWVEGVHLLVVVRSKMFNSQIANSLELIEKHPFRFPKISSSFLARVKILTLVHGWLLLLWKIEQFRRIYYTPTKCLS